MNRTTLISVLILSLSPFMQLAFTHAQGPQQLPPISKQEFVLAPRLSHTEPVNPLRNNQGKSRIAKVTKLKLESPDGGSKGGVVQFRKLPDRPERERQTRLPVRLPLSGSGRLETRPIQPETCTDDQKTEFTPLPHQPDRVFETKPQFELPSYNSNDIFEFHSLPPVNSAEDLEGDATENHVDPSTVVMSLRPRLENESVLSEPGAVGEFEQPEIRDDYDEQFENEFASKELLPGELVSESSIQGNGQWEDVDAEHASPTAVEDSVPANLIWWSRPVALPIEDDVTTLTISPDQLLQTALVASPKIKSVSLEPLIRDLQVIEADAEFDPMLFTRNLYEDRTDPVGNTLTTGGAEFLKDHIFSSNNGLRRKLRHGADVELSQRIGFQNSNSTFFVPQDQGTATLALNVSQPLMRGAGKYFNKIQIMIAQTNGGIAWDTFAADLQNELGELMSAYWQLYHERASYLQKRESLTRGNEILQLLENRRGLDSLPSQIARARSAVESRRTAMANALRDVKNTETRIRRLTGDRSGMSTVATELLPGVQPIDLQISLPIQNIVRTALENRPEVREAMKKVKVAALQLDVSANELLPNLSLLMGAYASGLEGGSGIERALVEQFSNTTPGYSLGLDFEIPYRNRAAQSRLTQQHLQLRKLQQELEETMLRVIAESKIAYRTVKTALATLQSAETSIDAAHQDLQQQLLRFRAFALVEGDLIEGQMPATLLNQLIDAQDRLLNAEGVYSQTMFELQVAYISLNRATGTLLQHAEVNWETMDDGELPRVEFQFNTQAADLR